MIGSAEILEPVLEDVSTWICNADTNFFEIHLNFISGVRARARPPQTWRALASPILSNHASGHFECSRYSQNSQAFQVPGAKTRLLVMITRDRLIRQL